MTDPKHMKSDHDELKEVLVEAIRALNSPDLMAEGLDYARMNEILYDRCVQATSQYHPFMIRRHRPNMKAQSCSNFFLKY